MHALEHAAVQRPAPIVGDNDGRPLRSVAMSLLLACSCGTPPVAVSAAPSDMAASTQSSTQDTARAPLDSRVPASPPPFVWADASGEGRAQVVWFRRDLELDVPPREASLHLFASSRYLLFV